MCILCLYFINYVRVICILICILCIYFTDYLTKALTLFNLFEVLLQDSQLDAWNEYYITT